MLTLTEAARLAGVSKTTLTRAIRAGRLSATPLEDGGFSIDPKHFSRIYKVKLPSQPVDPAIPAGLLRADELARLAPIEAPARPADPEEPVAMPSVNDNPPPGPAGEPAISAELSSIDDTRIADAGDALTTGASPLLLAAMTVDPPTNDFAPIEAQPISAGPSAVDKTTPSTLPAETGTDFASNIVDSRADEQPLAILDRALRAAPGAASVDLPAMAAPAAEPQPESSPGPDEPALTTRLSALDAEIQGLKHLLAEVKSNRDQLREDRDEWRDRADRLLENLRRPWWRRLAG